MTAHPTTIFDHPEPSLHDVLDAVEQLRGLVERSLSPSSPPREWLSIEEAATLVGRSPQCVRGWCRIYKVGVRVRGQWQVDRRCLRQFLADRFGEARLPAALR
jgi:hypothetical protein